MYLWELRKLQMKALFKATKTERSSPKNWTPDTECKTFIFFYTSLHNFKKIYI